MSRLSVAAATLAVCAAALGSHAGAAVTATVVAPQPARPTESGGRDSAATRGPLAIGAAVTDPSGTLIGHVTRVTTDKTGASVAEIRNNEAVYAIPLADLTARHGAAISDLPLSAVKHSDAAP